ncbi:MAG: pyrroline-5-carboxylate reductase [Desulfobulbaceae bacterium]|uniref:Pyrroline-5-carboxylate reductase n=1 Tax=Candidatus Desulfobia pelagia TaxID=2841692 RepID=A0A8J6NCJ1_9BACT|nr:pyrroline-5-carboxylate reductase [Candidatus Desulfobia pelagia]
MKLQEKIGFIGGGKMAEALIKGIVQSGLADSGQIMVVEPVSGRRQELEEAYCVSATANSEDTADCGIIILAVKPQIMDAVLDGLNNFISEKHLVISIAAGITISFIEERLSRGCRVVRVMPNTPALVLEGAAALSGGTRATQEDLEVGDRIFSAVGQCVTMDEKYLDAVTGLSGSGPAYVFSFIEALVDGGVKVGLNRNDAQLLAMQTLLGSVKLAMETGDHPAVLRAMVTSPGGTTIAGLHELEKAGFRAAVMNCVETATNRSKELGKQLKG